MITGGMQDWPLRVGTILNHAERVHGGREVVSRTVEGPIHRSTYAEVARRARKLAAALRRLGVGEGDRVGTLAWNTHRHLEAWYGISGLGAVCHTINPRLFEEQITYIIADADDRVILTDLTFVPMLEKWRDGCLAGRRIVVLTDAAHMPQSSLDLLCYEDLLAGEDGDFRWVEVPETAPAGLCYTSGTTGQPKGVVYTHRSNVLHALMLHGAECHAITAMSVVLPIVPLCHANAWGLAFTAPMAGAKLVLPGPKLDAESLYELIAGEGVTMAGAVSSVWISLLPMVRERGAGTLRRVLTGGTATPRWLLEGCDALGIAVAQAWGMTEMSPVGSVSAPRPEMASLSGEALIAQRLKQGAQVYGVELRIVDEAGVELAHDGQAAGRLQARGVAVTSGYFNGAGGQVLDPEGWFDSGDIATIDAMGFVAITDRTKDMIKSGGEWISSIALEGEASSHPEIREAAAIGVPNERWGERPLLIAVREAGSTIDEAGLLGWLAQRIAKWGLPDAVEFVDDLPHTATGKLDKLTLRKRFAAREEAVTLSG